MTFPASPGRPRRFRAGRVRTGGVRVRRALLGAPLALVMAHGAARAHALVVASDPAAETVLATPPARVIIRFNSRIDPVRSRLSMIPGEARQGAAALPLEVAAAADPTLIGAPCPPLSPGAWRLRWQVLAVDGHITRGDIAFSIRPGH